MKNLLSLIRGENPQSKYADMFGVTQACWWSWESGRTVPSPKTMLKMEHKFGIPMEQIFFEVFNYSDLSKNKE